MRCFNLSLYLSMPTKTTFVIVALHNFPRGKQIILILTGSAVGCQPEGFQNAGSHYPVDVEHKQGGGRHTHTRAPRTRRASPTRPAKPSATSRHSVRRTLAPLSSNRQTSRFRNNSPDFLDVIWAAGHEGRRRAETSWRVSLLPPNHRPAGTVRVLLKAPPPPCQRHVP